jgi:uncharacterized protein YukE
MSQKEESIAKYYEEEEEAAKRAFQSKVSRIMARMSELSSALKSAKKELSELEYKPPEKIEL